MIEKQLRKPLTKNELFKTTMIEAYPLYYIDNNSSKKIQFIPIDEFSYEVKRIDDYGEDIILSHQCIDEINEIWHVGGTVILMYDKKLKGYKTKVPFKYLTKSVKKMI